jgi:hypothetical protein
MSMDIKQRLQETIVFFEAHGTVGVPTIELCRDALAEIERLNESHCKAVSAARHIEALERIAEATENVARELGYITEHWDFR